MLRANAWQSFRVVLRALSPGEDFFGGKSRDHTTPGLSTTPSSCRLLHTGFLTPVFMLLNGSTGLHAQVQDRCSISEILARQ